MEQQQTVWVVSNINENQLLPLTVDKVCHLSQLPSRPPFAVILSKGEHQNWFDLLKTLRAKKEYRFTPVYYHGDIDDTIRVIFDGPADENTAINASVIHERLQRMAENITKTDDNDLILLAYIYSRGNQSLKGYVGHQSPAIYEYPIVDILLQPKKNFDTWGFLQDLVMRDLLKHQALVDEIQLCRSCQSGLLNLKTSCPSCRSIDIKPQKFIHCFSCGNIGPVPNFLRQERLICSSCYTKLDQLGVDYEKPLEDKLCNSCNYFFANSQLQVVCLSCHQTSTPNELCSKRLYNYALTTRGEHVVRGIEKSIYRNFSHFFEVIDYTSFMSIVIWQAKLSKRYSSIYFSVMTLQIINESELIDKLGEIKAERLVIQLFTELRQLFRQSDLTSRLDNTMFFLLPMSNQTSCLVILERIKQMVQALTADENLSLNLSYITSIEILQSTANCELIAAELHSRLLESNSCLISLR